MICHVGFGGRNPRDGELFAFLETVAGGFGGRVVVGRSGRRPAAPAEHRERAGRGDRDQLPGPDPALRADRGVRGPGDVSRRARAASRLHVRGRRVVHDPRRPRQVGTVGAVRRRGGAARPATSSTPTPTRRSVSSKTTLSLQAGDVISIQSCGGGGYGPPDRRDPGGRPARRARRADLRRARGRDALPRRGRRRGRAPSTTQRTARAPGGLGLDGLPARASTSAARSPTRSSSTRRPARSRISKVSTTPADPSEGFLARHGPDPRLGRARTPAASATSSTARPSRRTRSSSARSPGPR